MVLSDLPALLAGFFGNRCYFFAYVAGLLPLLAVFFGSFFARIRALLFAYLAGSFLETSGVFLTLSARRVPLFALAHHSPPNILRATMIVRPAAASVGDAFEQVAW